MSRFGFSVIDELLLKLTDKKPNAPCLHFLLQNIPPILICDNGTQETLQTMLRHYFLRHATKISAFILAFTKKMFAENTSPHAQKLSPLQKKVWLKHLMALYAVASEIDSPLLVDDLITCIDQMPRERYFYSIVSTVRDSKDLPPLYLQHLNYLLRSSAKKANVISLVAVKRKKKHGRKLLMIPEEMSNLHAIMALSEEDTKHSKLLKAS